MGALVNAMALFAQSVMENIAAKTATFNGTAFDTLDHDGQVGITQLVGVVSGTTPTLDGKVQSSDTSGGTYADVPGATFTQVTVTNNHQRKVVDLNNCKRFIRYVGNIAGTTPSFTVGVLFEGLKKVQP